MNNTRVDFNVRLPEIEYIDTKATVETKRVKVDKSLWVDIINKHGKTTVGEGPFIVEDLNDIEDYIVEFNTVKEEEINVEKGYEYYKIEEYLFDNYYVHFEKWFYSGTTEVDNIEILEIEKEVVEITSQEELLDLIDGEVKPKVDITIDGTLIYLLDKNNIEYTIK